MKKIQILLVCCHPEISATIIRLINKNEDMLGTAVASPEAAVASFSSNSFDLVLIGAGLTPETEKQLETRIKTINPTVPVIYHFGGGSGLLYTELKQALHQAKLKK